MLHEFFMTISSFEVGVWADWVTPTRVIPECLCYLPTPIRWQVFALHQYTIQAKNVAPENCL
jgi:hypothetical protein